MGRAWSPPFLSTVVSATLHAEDRQHDFLQARVAKRMAVLLNTSDSGGCIQRLLHSHPRTSTAILIGCSDLAQRAVAGLLTHPAEQQQSSRRAAAHLQDQPACLKQLAYAGAGLFVPLLAPNWPGPGLADAAVLRKHLQKLISHLCILLLPEDQVLPGQLAQPFGSACSSGSVGRTSLLHAAAAEALASLAWQLVAAAQDSGVPASTPAADLHMRQQLCLVSLVTNAAASLAAAACHGRSIEESASDSHMRLAGVCLRAAAALWSCCLEYSWAASGSLSSREAGTVLITYGDLCSTLRQLRRLGLAGDARLYRAVATPAAQFVEAATRALGRLCQVAGSAATDLEFSTPLLSTSTIIIQTAFSVGTPAPSDASHAGWRPLLELLRSASKLCCQAAADAKQLCADESSVVPASQLSAVVDVARYAVVLLETVGWASLRACRRRDTADQSGADRWAAEHAALLC